MKGLRKLDYYKNEQVKDIIKEKLIFAKKKYKKYKMFNYYGCLKIKIKV